MLEAPVRYRIADLLTNSLIETRTLRRRTDRADRSRSVTAWSRLTALPSRIDADELTFATADGPPFFQPLPVGDQIQVAETTATPSSARETSIGRGKPDQVLSKKFQIFLLQSFHFSDLRRGTVRHRGLQPVDNARDRRSDRYLMCRGPKLRRSRVPA